MRNKVMVVVGVVVAKFALGVWQPCFAPAKTVGDAPKPAMHTTDVVWDIGAKGFFDRTNKEYPIVGKRVTVDLRGKVVQCPTGLGHLASGRDNVREILFLFESGGEGDYWFHMLWNPGGNGKEQIEVVLNGASVGRSRLIDGKKEPYLKTHERLKVRLGKGLNELLLRHLSGDGLRFENVVLCKSERLPPLLNPELKFPTLESYEAVIGEPGVILDSDRIRLFAPKRKARAAKIIFGYLVRAYEELYRLVGVHTEYKIVVYHFPDKSREASGGTSNCTIWYGYKNLGLEAHSEWSRHRVPHVSGYIEEMAHNFVHTTRAQFGWEMIGWTIGTKATQRVARNPIHDSHVRQTRAGQKRTFERYRRGGYVFPRDLPANQCDRIHAYLLWECEKEYGPNFWRDFFREVRKARAPLRSAAKLGDADRVRNGRYQITIECFNRLGKLNFKRKLKELRISLTTDIKSLHPTEPTWNRTFLAAGEE